MIPVIVKGVMLVGKIYYEQNLYHVQILRIGIHSITHDITSTMFLNKQKKLQFILTPPTLPPPTPPATH